MRSDVFVSGGHYCPPIVMCSGSSAIRRIRSSPHPGHSRSQIWIKSSPSAKSLNRPRKSLPHWQDMVWCISSHQPKSAWIRVIISSEPMSADHVGPMNNKRPASERRDEDDKSEGDSSHNFIWPHYYPASILNCLYLKSGSPSSTMILTSKRGCMVGSRLLTP